MACQVIKVQSVEIFTWLRDLQTFLIKAAESTVHFYLNKVLLKMTETFLVVLNELYGLQNVSLVSCDLSVPNLYKERYPCHFQFEFEVADGDHSRLTWKQSFYVNYRILAAINPDLSFTYKHGWLSSNYVGATSR